MNQDTVASSMAKRLGIQKSELLNKDSSNLAVKMATSETLIINQTK
jgi:multiple RNA-binding domain-containing protein 1